MVYSAGDCWGYHVSQLRDYQTATIDRVRTHMRAGRRRVLAVLPTGAGKTRTAAEVVCRVVANGQRALWFAHRAELVDQAVAELTRHGLVVGALSASAQSPPNPFAHVQVATIQTLLARKERPRADLLVADEAHHYVADEFSTLIADYPSAITLGLTATPERSDGRGLGEIFDALVVGATIKQLTSLGHLVPCEIIRPSKHLQSGQIAQSPIDAYVQHAMGRKAIVFARSIELAEAYAADYNLRGIAARTISAETPWPERCLYLDDFKRGKVRVLCNVFALTEGLDVPDMSCVILARGFSTSGPYLQAVGRALRPAPRKSDALVIDLRGATWELGHPEDERVYSLDGKGIRLSDANTYCPVCGAARIPGEGCTACGWQTTVDEGKPDKVTGDPLVKYAQIRRDDADARVARLAKWIAAGKAAGHKETAACHKFKAVYGAWPASVVLSAARERAGEVAA